MVARVEDLCFHFREFHGCETDLIGRGLTVDKSIGQRRRQHLFGMGRCDLGEIAKHVVVFDLERRDPSERDEILLHLRDDAAAFVA